MRITKDSHLDHGLSKEVIKFIKRKFGKKKKFFIDTVKLPEGMSVPCGLYGPIVDDTPVMEHMVTYERRGEREYPSRLINLPPRQTNIITVIAGPHENEKCILYTAFGGPLTPKEPGDSTIKSKAERKGSEKFWAEHALAKV